MKFLSVIQDIGIIIGLVLLCIIAAAVGLVYCVIVILPGIILASLGGLAALICGTLIVITKKILGVK
jgi:hypothetical protein